MRNGVTFNNRHTFFDFGLLTKKTPVISPPKPKTKLVEVFGSDGVIDLTRSLTGKVHYQQRQIVCEFVLLGDPEKQNNVYTEVLNHIQGKQTKITLDCDPEYYYDGIAEITKWKPGQFSATMEITATVEPYKTAKHLNGKKVL